MLTYSFDLASNSKKQPTMYSRLLTIIALSLPLLAVATSSHVARDTPTTACCASTEPVRTTLLLHLGMLTHSTVGQLCCGRCHSQGHRSRCERRQRPDWAGLLSGRRYRRWLWLGVQWYHRYLHERRCGTSILPPFEGRCD